MYFWAGCTDFRKLFSDTMFVSVRRDKVMTLNLHPETDYCKISYTDETDALIEAFLRINGSSKTLRSRGGSKNSAANPLAIAGSDT